MNESKIMVALKEAKCSFVGFEAETMPKLAVKKFQASFGKHPKEVVLIKFAQVVGLIGTSIDYAMLVQNRLLKESQLKDCKPVDWKKEKLADFKIRLDGVETQHKTNGQRYITVHCVANVKPKVRYELDGKELTKEEVALIKECLPKSKSKKQEDAGIENPVIYREYKLESFKSIKVKGETITH